MVDNEVALIALADAAPSSAMLMFDELARIITTRARGILTDTFTNRNWQRLAKAS